MEFSWDQDAEDDYAAWSKRIRKMPDYHNTAAALVEVFAFIKHSVLEGEVEGLPVPIKVRRSSGKLVNLYVIRKRNVLFCFAIDNDVLRLVYCGEYRSLFSLRRTLYTYIAKAKKRIQRW